MAGRPGRVVVSVEALAAPIESGWVARLGAAVRPEFRAEVLVPAVADPILGSPGVRGARVCAFESLRRAVPGPSGPVEKGWSSRPARVGDDR